MFTKRLLRSYPQPYIGAIQAGLVALLTIVGPIAAYAETDSQDGRARALILAEEAQGAYDDERFEDAVVLLREALELFPAPVLYYNLGLAHEQLGQREAALEVYERYLDQPDEPDDREDVERRMTAMRASIRAESDTEESTDASPQDDPAETPLPPPSEGGRTGRVGPWPWALMGIGLAIAAAGGVVGVLALVERQSAIDDPIQRSAVDSIERSDGYGIAFDVMVPLGGVIALAGLIWALVSRSRASRAAQNSLASLCLERSTW